MPNIEPLSIRIISISINIRNFLFFEYAQKDKFWKFMGMDDESASYIYIYD